MQFPSNDVCVFCRGMHAGTQQMIAQNSTCIALWDGYPLNPGHALIIPRRHEEDFFALSDEERAGLFALLPAVRMVIEAEYEVPDGYNIGMNIGEQGGQTVAHTHLHLIPRLIGDTKVTGGQSQPARGGLKLPIDKSRGFS